MQPSLPPISPFLAGSAAAPVRFWIGVDGGGTHTRARLFDAGGHALGEGLARPSTLGQGLEQAWLHPVVWDRANDRSLVQALHLTGALWGFGLGALATRLPLRWPAAPARDAGSDDPVHP